MIVEPAPAKINLALHVRRRRADGYHDIETLFAFAAHGDIVNVAPDDTDRFTITGPFAAALGHPHPSPPSAALPSPAGSVGWTVSRTVQSRLGAWTTRRWREARQHRKGEGDGDNLVIRARDAFRATFGLPPVAIALDKHLPVASGIGGGSADAAATLRALATLRGVPRDDPRLDAIAATLGADVPACLHGRTALGTGKGDALTPLDGLAGTPLLLVNPRIPVSTAAVFAGWDGIDRGPIPAGGLLARARAARNDLEPPARRIAPAIDAVLADLAVAPGVLLARMSGSGATCFALFADAAARDRAGDAAAAKDWWTLATVIA